MNTTSEELLKGMHHSKLFTKGLIQLCFCILGAPVTYIHIYDDQTSVASSIFALKEGSSLPLHDHPNMHGFIKCISGKLLLTSYSKIWEKSFHDSNTQGNADLRSSGDYNRKRLRVGANKQPDKILTEHDSETAALQPEQGNIHTITAIDGPAAFIDFLAPPYSDGTQHTCHYFQIESSDHVNDIHTLLEISCPPWYWCADAPYIGPQIPVS